LCFYKYVLLIINVFYLKARTRKPITNKRNHIFNDSKQRYGAPKSHHLLGVDGYRVILKRVQRLMKKANIRSITTKKFCPTPSKEKVIEHENILEQDFETTTINEKWAGNITYIHTLKHGWCYLASVLDLHTRKVVGYSFGRTITMEINQDRITKCIRNTAYWG